jgi:hypothetical protein
MELGYIDFYFKHKTSLKTDISYGSYSSGYLFQYVLILGVL